MHGGNPERTGDVVLAVDVPREAAEVWEQEERTGYIVFKVEGEQLNMCYAPLVFCTDYGTRTIAELRQLIETNDESKTPYKRSIEQIAEFVELMENIPLQ